LIVGDEVADVGLVVDDQDIGAHCCISAIFSALVSALPEPAAAAPVVSAFGTAAPSRRGASRLPPGAGPSVWRARG
ncbi:hypothetical protein, partial [Stenotrophomonas maltophilia]|uniref:hypothetical protein n=1 Tax=Stenotrophomonas maltophilia TaxID=40324 RepID=UPI0019542D1B